MDAIAKVGMLCGATEEWQRAIIAQSKGKVTMNFVIEDADRLAQGKARLRLPRRTVSARAKSWAAHNEPHGVARVWRWAHFSCLCSRGVGACSTLKKPPSRRQEASIELDSSATLMGIFKINLCVRVVGSVCHVLFRIEA